MEDYAIALVDELEHPKHLRQRFTIGYQSRPVNRSCSWCIVCYCNAYF